MARAQVLRVIGAPADQVFAAVADIDNFSKAVPHITKVEKLFGAAKTGGGTRFRETRLMNGQETTTDLEVTEYSENPR